MIYLINNRHPKLCCRYKESNSVGEDIFRKFSGYIKNPNPGLNDSKNFETFKSLMLYIWWKEPPWVNRKPATSFSAREEISFHSGEAEHVSRNSSPSRAGQKPRSYCVFTSLPGWWQPYLGRLQLASQTQHCQGEQNSAILCVYKPFVLFCFLILKKREIFTVIWIVEMIWEM